MIKIDRTETVKTVSPQPKPIAKGIPPIAAWTVAFGIQVNIQNIRSLIVNLVFIRQNNTPIILKIKQYRIIVIVGSPEERAYLIFTVAPTRTNNIISASTQSLEYLEDNLTASLGYFLK